MFKLTYTWDEQTYIRASKALYEYEMGHSTKKYIGWFFIALTQFGVVAAIKQGDGILLIVSTFLVLYWYLLRWRVREFFLKKAFRKLPNANAKISILLHDNSLQINDTTIPLHEIADFLELSNGMYLLYHDTSIYIPHSAFKSEEELNSFVKRLKNSQEKRGS